MRLCFASLMRPDNKEEHEQVGDGICDYTRA